MELRFRAVALAVGLSLGVGFRGSTALTRSRGRQPRAIGIRRVKEEQRTGESSFLDELLSRMPKLQQGDDQLFAPWPRRRPDPSVADPAEVLQHTSHYVVLMRHGESAFNQHNVFTGWCDVPLTDQGREEARNAGEIMGSRNLKFDVAFSSVLQRSSVTCHVALEAAGQSWIETRSRWELNERHYGNLQGLSKEETAQNMGRDVVHAWRQKYHSAPPPMQENHPHWPITAGDRRYQHLVDAGTLPRSESLADTAVRVMDLWNTEIAPLVKAGKRVLIVAHRNSLRALIRNLEGLDDDEVARMQIPTGQPFVYPLDSNLRPTAVPLVCDGNNNEPGCGFQGIFLKDDPCMDGYRERQESCLLKWADDPSVLPRECLEASPDECQIDKHYSF